MAQEDIQILHDTYAALQRAQLEREKQLRSTEREAAGRVVESYGKRNGWPEQDITEVRCALGLGGDECQSCGKPFDMIRYRYLCPHCKTKNTCCE